MKILKDRRTVQGKYVFTQDETKENTEKLLSVMSEKEQIEAEAKQVSAQYKNKIAGKDLELKSLRTALENGHEYRPFECEAVKNFDSGYMEFIDELTGDIIAKEKLTANDYQTNMDEQLDLIAANNKRDDASDQLGLVIMDRVKEAGAEVSIFDEAVAAEDGGNTTFVEQLSGPITEDQTPQTPNEETFTPVVEPVKEKPKRNTKAKDKVEPAEPEYQAPPIGDEEQEDEDWWNKD